MAEIAAGAGRKRAWHSNRAVDGRADSGRQLQRTFKQELHAAKAQAGARSKTRPRAKAKQSVRSCPKPTAKQKSAAAATASKRSGPVPPAGRRRAALPDFVPPSLATLHTAAPSGPRWLHEIKFDGYRIEARLDRGKVQLLTRNRQDWTRRFKPIADAIAVLPAKTALLDGELVVENEKGISSFSLLQTDLKEGRSDRFVYWMFDLLHLDGRDMTEKPLIERKAVLERLLGEEVTGPIRYAEHLHTDGASLFKRACELGLEGVVSKRRDAPHRSGRTDNFIKSKCHDEQEFVVVGLAPSTAMPRAVGALIVAFHESGQLRYAGRIGTGYTRSTARDLW
ncbi:MAG: non-homologous end-joining DNA ligase, partial [Pseudomonadota bacterium]